MPLPRRSLTRSLFGLIQLMYLIFYVSALFRLSEIDRITSTFLPGWGSRVLFVAVMITAGVGIPLRCYLISAVAFDHRALGVKIPADVSLHSGAGPVVGGGPVSARRKHRVWGRIRGDGGASVCAVFRENAGAIGVSACRSPDNPLACLGTLLTKAAYHRLRPRQAADFRFQNSDFRFQI